MYFFHALILLKFLPCNQKIRLLNFKLKYISKLCTNNFIVNNLFIKWNKLILIGQIS